MAITYTPTTNFGAKDSLPTNDPDKVIKGSEFTTEFTALQTAFSLAAPNASPTFTGTVTIPTADINGGNIDGTVIGAATPAAGSFTTLTASGNVGIKTSSPATTLDVAGTITADGLTLGQSHVLDFQSGAGEKILSPAVGVLSLASRGNVDIYVDTNNNDAASAAEFSIYKSADVGVAAAKILSATKEGDISFYEDTGTTPKFFWDASAEALGIGTTSPSAPLELQYATGNFSATYNDFSGVGLFISSDGTAGDGNLSGAIAFDSPDRSTSKHAAIVPVQTGADGNQVGLSFWVHPSSTRQTDLLEAARITSAGNVGIGTSSPSSNCRLHVTDADVQMELEGTVGSNSGFIDFDGTNLQLSTTRDMKTGAFRNTGKSNATVILTGASGGSTIRMYTAPADNTVATERARIDSSGNLLVGKSTSDIGATAGFEWYDTGNVLLLTRSAGQALSVNRLTSDGDLTTFRKDGSTIGSIGIKTSRLYFAQAGGSGIAASGVNLLPTDGTGAPNDNTNDIGFSSFRFDDIYATNGTIQTSDANEKQDIAELDEAERRVAVAAKGLLRKFRWKESVAEKGDDARIHFGIIAQDLQAAFEAEGLDVGRYAMFIHSTWTDEKTGEERSRMGVRYSELLAFIIAAL